MKTKRLNVTQVNDENSAREFVVSKLVDLVMAVDTKNAKFIKNQEIAYKGTSEFIQEQYNIDTTPYDSIATKLVKGTFD